MQIWIISQKLDSLLYGLQLQYQGMGVLRADVQMLQKQLGYPVAAPRRATATTQEEPPPIPKKMPKAEAVSRAEGLELVYDDVYDDAGTHTTHSSV